MQMTNIHPILMKSEFSVPRILDGKKTQTRRDSNLKEINKNPADWELIETTNYVSWDAQPPIYYKAAVFQHKDGDKMVRLCPFGEKDHWLWVRETFAEMCKEADPHCHCESEEQIRENHYYEYKADTGNRYPGYWDDASEGEVPEHVHWKPSIHMPKKAARLWLKLKDIRIEKLGDIYESDAIKEGVHYKPNAYKEFYRFRDYTTDRLVEPTDPTVSFFTLWEHLFQEKVTPEVKAKWVWVIEFIPCHRNIPDGNPDKWLTDFDQIPRKNMALEDFNFKGKMPYY